MASHRMWLTREIEQSLWETNRRLVNFIMLNPSVAGAESGDDPTIRKVMGFCRMAGASELAVTNLFTQRSTQPSALRSDALNDPRADDCLKRWMARADIVVAAWGSGAGLRANVRREFSERVKRVVAFARATPRQLRCVGVTKSGHPRHPLYAPYPLDHHIDDVFPVWKS